MLRAIEMEEKRKFRSTTERQRRTVGLNAGQTGKKLDREHTKDAGPDAELRDETPPDFISVRTSESEAGSDAAESRSEEDMEVPPSAEKGVEPGTGGGEVRMNYAAAVIRPGSRKVSSSSSSASSSPSSGRPSPLPPSPPLQYPSPGLQDCGEPGTAPGLGGSAAKRKDCATAVSQPRLLVTQAEVNQSSSTSLSSSPPHGGPSPLLTPSTLQDTPESEKKAPSAKRRLPSIPTGSGPGSGDRLHVSVQKVTPSPELIPIAARLRAIAEEVAEARKERASQGGRLTREDSSSTQPKRALFQSPGAETKGMGESGGFSQKPNANDRNATRSAGTVPNRKGSTGETPRGWVEKDHNSVGNIPIPPKMEFPLILTDRKKGQGRFRSFGPKYTIFDTVQGLGRPRRITTLPDDRFLLDCVNGTQRQRIAHLDNLGGTTIQCHIPRPSIQGVIGPIADLDIHKAQRDLQRSGVTQVDWERGQGGEHPRKIRLTFNLKSLPSMVHLDGKKWHVTALIRRTTTRCRKCLRFGHSGRTCERGRACYRCGGSGHQKTDCRAPPRCVNCQGNHTSEDGRCPELSIRDRADQYKAHNAVTYSEALRMARRPDAHKAEAAPWSETASHTKTRVTTQDRRPADHDHGSHRSSIIEHQKEPRIRTGLKPSNQQQPMVKTTSRLIHKGRSPLRDQEQREKRRPSTELRETASKAAPPLGSSTISSTDFTSSNTTAITPPPPEEFVTISRTAFEGLREGSNSELKRILVDAILQSQQNIRWEAWYGLTLERGKEDAYDETSTDTRKLSPGERFVMLSTQLLRLMAGALIHKRPFEIAEALTTWYRMTTGDDVAIPESPPATWINPLRILGFYNLSHQ